MYQNSTDIIIINHVSAEIIELFGGKLSTLSNSDVLPKSPYILFFLCHSTVAIVTTIVTKMADRYTLPIFYENECIIRIICRYDTFVYIPEHLKKGTVYTYILLQLSGGLYPDVNRQIILTEEDIPLVAF